MAFVNAEKKRGYQEAGIQFEALRARWPLAFPAKSHLVRPLAIGLLDTIAAEMGWTKFYTRAVLERWKARDAYCQAVLRHPARIALDGSETGDVVDDVACANAHETLARNERGRERRKMTTAPAVDVAEPSPRSEPPPERKERPEAACPPELLQGLDLTRQEDQARFRLRVVRRYQGMSPEALLNEAFAVTGERLPPNTSATAICKAIAKCWIERAGA